MGASNQIRVGEKPGKVQAAAKKRTFDIACLSKKARHWPAAASVSRLPVPFSDMA